MDEIKMRRLRLCRVPFYARDSVNSHVIISISCSDTQVWCHPFPVREMLSESYQEAHFRFTGQVNSTDDLQLQIAKMYKKKSMCLYFESLVHRHILVCHLELNTLNIKYSWGWVILQVLVHKENHWTDWPDGGAIRYSRGWIHPVRNIQAVNSVV